MKRTSNIPAILAAFGAACLLTASLAVAQDRADERDEAKQPATDREQADDASKSTHSGQVVSVEEGQLTMSIDGRNQHRHRVGEDAKVTLNGKPAKLMDLKAGDKIKVTTEKGNAAVALAIEATRDDAAREDAATREDREDTARDDRRDTATAESDAESRGQSGLGVGLAESDGGGVLIRTVAVGGAAAEAGVKPGDYILSINGEKVSSPAAAEKQLASLKAREDVKLVIYRDGAERTVTAKLGERRSAAFDPSDREGREPREGREGREPREGAEGRTDGAWLGIILSPDDQERAVIARVYPESPAAQAGLRPGDVIMMIGDSRVTSSEQLTQSSEKLAVNKKVMVRVQREGREMSVELTPVSQRSFFEAEGREGFAADRGTGQGQMRRIETMLEQIQTDLRQLRQDVNELKQGRTGTDRSGADRSGTDRSGTDRSGTERPGTERPGTARPGTDRTEDPARDDLPRSDSPRRDR